LTRYNFARSKRVRITIPVKSIGTIFQFRPFTILTDYTRISHIPVGHPLKHCTFIFLFREFTSIIDAELLHSAIIDILNNPPFRTVVPIVFQDVSIRWKPALRLVRLFICFPVTFKFRPFLQIIEIRLMPPLPNSLIPDIHISYILKCFFIIFKGIIAHCFYMILTVSFWNLQENRLLIPSIKDLYTFI